MPTPLISIITPTMGEPSMVKMMKSLYAQDIDFEHIVLWDNAWAGDDNSVVDCVEPEEICDGSWVKSFNIDMPGKMVQGIAAGSALRSVGLMAAKGEYVTFADSDVWHEPNHLQNLLDTVKGKQWGLCRRKIWNTTGEYLGVDNFESIGNSPERKVPYVLVDNNTMIFERKFGASGAVLYRETQEYNDDRLMTEFLYKYAGEPGISEEATVNQVCPQKLESMFEKYCTK